MKNPKVTNLAVSQAKFPIYYKSYRNLLVDLNNLHSKGELPPKQEIFVVERYVGADRWYVAKLKHTETRWDKILAVYKTDVDGRIVSTIDKIIDML